MYIYRNENVVKEILKRFSFWFWYYRILMPFSSLPTLRPLAYSILADLVHHIRTYLTLPNLSLAVHVFSRNVHDDSLPVSIQTMSCKLLLNLVESIRVKAEQEPSVSAVDTLLSLLVGNVASFPRGSGGVSPSCDNFDFWTHLQTKMCKCKVKGREPGNEATYNVHVYMYNEHTPANTTCTCTYVHTFRRGKFWCAWWRCSSLSSSQLPSTRSQTSSGDGEIATPNTINVFHISPPYMYMTPFSLTHSHTHTARTNLTMQRATPPTPVLLVWVCREPEKLVWSRQRRDWEFPAAAPHVRHIPYFHTSILPYLHISILSYFHTSIPPYFHKPLSSLPPQPPYPPPLLPSLPRPLSQWPTVEASWRHWCVAWRPSRGGQGPARCLAPQWTTVSLLMPGCI